MHARPWLRAFAEGLLDLVFAPICVACGGPIATEEPARLVCRICWSRARPLPLPRCPRCWTPTQPGPPRACQLCASFPLGLRLACSAYVMEPPVREMIHAFKYRAWVALAGPMAQRLAELPLPADVAEEADLVVPVPISRVRLRQRGFNQAALLARSFARLTGRTCAETSLVRVRATETQTALHPAERRANVAHAFRVAPESTRELDGRHVLVIDDVWTTGATALACAEALLEGPARAVSVLTFARALAERAPGVEAPTLSSRR